MKMLLAGAWVDRDKKIDVTDPYDNSLIDTVPAASSEDVETALEAAVKGYEVARRMPAHDRAQILYRTAQIVEDQQEAFARLIAREGSKTIREARKEVSRCRNTLVVSAEESKRLLGETIPFNSFPGGEKRRGYYERVPVGVVLAITPFNDPLNLVAHKLGPAVAAGNSVILKPATVTPLSGIKLVEAFMQAGLPPLVMQVLTGHGAIIGDPLVKDKRVRMISFTGGLESGLHLTSVAGIKKLGLELGSNSPVIVWKDADLPYAVETCVSGAFWAAGQNCIGVQRIYVHRDIYDEFQDCFVKLTKSYRIGNKLDEATDMGPMIAEGEAKRLEGWIHEAQNLGATVPLRREAQRLPAGAHRPRENVPEKANLHKEEVFGPTVNLYPV